jgi:hypothetical protein
MPGGNTEPPRLPQAALNAPRSSAVSALLDDLQSVNFPLRQGLRKYEPSALANDTVNIREIGAALCGHR